MTDFHESVLLNESVEHLQVKAGNKYIDCTLGDGGHTLEILKRGGITLALDRDPEAIKRAGARLKSFIDNGMCVLVKGNFKEVAKIAATSGFERVHGVLYDLGTSYSQLSDDSRGFSFTSSQRLDMRMDPELSVTAADLVNGLSEKELKALISNYGGEHFAGRIAKAIVKARKDRLLNLCVDLADVIARAVPRVGNRSIHPATKTFQALRIAVNDELTNLDVSLKRVVAESLVIPGGRIVIVSFHSLEEKIAKSARPGFRSLTEKPIVPSSEEVLRNPRARSAKMRILEKL